MAWLNMVEFVFNAIPVKKTNVFGYEHTYLQVYVLISDRELIREIAEKIIKDGYYPIKGKLIFKNPYTALLKLKKLNLI